MSMHADENGGARAVEKGCNVQCPLQKTKGEIPSAAHHSSLAAHHFPFAFIGVELRFHPSGPFRPSAASRLLRSTPSEPLPQSPALITRNPEQQGEIPPDKPCRRRRREKTAPDDATRSVSGVAGYPRGGTRREERFASATTWFTKGVRPFRVRPRANDFRRRRIPPLPHARRPSWRTRVIGERLAVCAAVRTWSWRCPLRQPPSATTT